MVQESYQHELSAIAEGASWLGDDCLAPVIAIVGSDGAGKSTVGDALLAWLREQGPAELCHLGKQSGNLARLIGRIPLVGRRVETGLENKVQKAEGDRGPGFLTSIGIYAFTVRRMWRFRRMLRLQREGVTVLADRFPQVSHPAAIDGPGFGRMRCDRGLARILAPIELRQFEWMASHRPDLVIRLNVDPETAMARKPDHAPEKLVAKVQEIRQLTFGGAPIVDIDASQPLDAVLAEAKAAISAMPRK